MSVTNNRFSSPSPPNSNLNAPSNNSVHTRSPSPSFQKSNSITASQIARQNHARQSFASSASKSPVSPRVQRPTSELVGNGVHHNWNTQSMLAPTQLPSSAGLGMSSPDTIDQWFENLGSYEETLEEMAAASLDQNFKEELVAIEQWFRVLSEAERTAALYSLLQHSTQMQIRFFITVLQQMSRSDPLSAALFSPSMNNGNGFDTPQQYDTDLARMSLKSPNLATVSGITSAKASPNLSSLNRQSLAAEHHLSPDDALASHRARLNNKRTSAPGHLPGPGTIGAGSSSDNLRSPNNWHRGSSNLEQVQERSPTPSERPKSSDSNSFVRSESMQDLNDEQSLNYNSAAANLSPLPNSGNWASMVNTPSIGNFNQPNLSSGLDNASNELQNWYNGNGNIKLDDARKFRRASRQLSNYDDEDLVGYYGNNGNGGNNGGLLTPGGTSNQNLQQLLIQQQQLINNLSQPTSPNPLNNGNPLLSLQLQSLHQQQQLLQQQQLALGRLQQQQQQQQHSVSASRQGPGLGIYSSNNNGSRMGSSPYKSTFGNSLPNPNNNNNVNNNKKSNTQQSRQRNVNAEEDITEEVLSDIPTWLRILRLHKYTPNFIDCDWKSMVVMTDNDLEQKGVAALGARRKMLKEFEKVREKYGIPAKVTDDNSHNNNDNINE